MMRPKRRKSRVLVWVLTILVVLGIGAAVAYYRGIAPLYSLTVAPVDLTQVSDGQYTGAYSTIPVRATVQVTVADHRITDIKILKHFTGQGQAGEAVTGRVIAAQSLSVDTVAGATYSSNVILKAIELALRQGIK